MGPSFSVRQEKARVRSSSSILADLTVSGMAFNFIGGASSRSLLLSNNFFFRLDLQQPWRQYSCEKGFDRIGVASYKVPGVGRSAKISRGSLSISHIFSNHQESSMPSARLHPSANLPC